MPTERVDAVVAGDELGLALAEELERLAPFGIANPSVSLLVPAARLVDARPMGEEGRHVRFTVEAGGHRARAVAFGMSRLPDGDVHDATFTLELNEWNGAVEPRLVLRHAQAPAPAAVALAGEAEDPVEAALAEPAAPLPVAGATSRAAGVPRDRRGGRRGRHAGGAVASGEPLLVACADARRRRGHLAGRLGGFAVAGGTRSNATGAHRALRARPRADPPASDAQAALVDERFTLAWGEAEAEYALRAHQAGVRSAPGGRGGVPRAARRRGRCARRHPLSAAAAAPADLLAAAVAAAPSPAAAGRALRVLDELGLVRLDGAR